MNNISKVKEELGWIKIEKLDEIPFTIHTHKLYMVYCEKADLLFRKPKTGEFKGGSSP